MNGSTKDRWVIFVFEPLRMYSSIERFLDQSMSLSTIDELTFSLRATTSILVYFNTERQA